MEGNYGRQQLGDLLKEAQYLQKMKQNDFQSRAQRHDPTVRRVINFIGNGHVAKAFRMLKNDSGGGVIPLEEIVNNKTVLQHLEDMHPTASEGIGVTANFILSRIAMLKALRHNMQYGDCIRALRSRIGFGLAKAASMTIRAARSPEGSMGLPPADED
ncbi:hypothetical protein GJ496_004830 [Pomphorhynchus laevis]|nr:hypothetical protein GJ496_004830 [Pomphorhynchus laevis]